MSSLATMRFDVRCIGPGERLPRQIPALDATQGGGPLQLSVREYFATRCTSREARDRALTSRNACAHDFGTRSMLIS